MRLVARLGVGIVVLRGGGDEGRATGSETAGTFSLRRPIFIAVLGSNTGQPSARRNVRATAVTNQLFIFGQRTTVWCCS